MDELRRELENSELDLAALIHTPIKFPHWRYVLRRFLSDKRLITLAQRAFEFAEGQEEFLVDDRLFALGERIQRDAMNVLRYYGYIAEPHADGSWTWTQL